MNIFDLQVHSTVSDGKLLPKEVVELAKTRNVKVISLTDHDAVEGIDEALRVGEEKEIKVIPGIEISVEEHGAHILGYGINHHNPELLASLSESRQTRIEGAKQMTENLKNVGFFLEWEDVLKESSGSFVVTRPHIARAILSNPKNAEKLNGVNNTHNFIDKFLSNESPNYTPRAHIPAKEAIEIIKKSKGVAVWAHPAIHFSGNYNELEVFLEELISYGLRGIEVFTSAHTEEEAEFIQNLCLVKSLLRTAGSDFHDPKEYPPDERGLCPASFVGDYETYGFSTDDIVENLEKEINKINN